MEQMHRPPSFSVLVTVHKRNRRSWLRTFIFPPIAFQKNMLTNACVVLYTQSCNLTTHSFSWLNKHMYFSFMLLDWIYIYIYIYICVCVCVCVFLIYCLWVKVRQNNALRNIFVSIDSWALQNIDSICLPVTHKRLTSLYDGNESHRDWGVIAGKTPFLSTRKLWNIDNLITFWSPRCSAPNHTEKHSVSNVVSIQTFESICW
jgi:hypothetical protein